MSPSPAATEGAGLVVALPAEAHCVGARGMRAGDCQRWQHGWIAVAGIGPHNAMRAAERLLACGVSQLASWGVAGALDAKLAPGDVLIPDRVLHALDDPGFATDSGLRACLDSALARYLVVRRGTLWSAARPVTTQAGKQSLAARSGAIAVDMEAAAVAAVAARARLPFVALKAICDPATRELPASIVHALDVSDGGVSWRMVAAILTGGPLAWRAARALAHDFACARRSLTTAAALAA
ncbi:MAG: hypothetical protein EPN38_06575 [Rhodanobacteraceae bacterium]|nr:MAG: hypothetical protein EPN38_06575 [Rhodanobacteraceae bacterium]